MSLLGKSTNQGIFVYLGSLNLKNSSLPHVARSHFYHFIHYLSSQANNINNLSRRHPFHESSDPFFRASSNVIVLMCSPFDVKTALFSLFLIVFLFFPILNLSKVQSLHVQSLTSLYSYFLIHTFNMSPFAQYGAIIPPQSTTLPLKVGRSSGKDP